MVAHLFVAVLAVLLAERLLEVALSRRNLARLRARGGRVVERDGFGALKVVHAAFILGLFVEYWFAPWAGAWTGTWPLLGLALAAFLLRYWVMRTLGDRWSVRVAVLPGAAPVTGGPYRVVRHPNYVAVVLELLAVPLAFGCIATAVLASVSNAWALGRRIRIEEAALEDAGGYEASFAGRGRLVP